MVEAIVGNVVQILGRLLIEEAKFLSGVTDQVKEISKELKHVQCFLRDADAREYKDEVVSNWLREVRSLAYRIEDIVETFAVEVAGNRGKGIFTRFGSIFAEGRSRHVLGLEIGKLKTDINNLITSFHRYDIRATSEAESSGATTNDNLKWARQTYAHELEEHFVGKEEDIRKLVSLMVDDRKHHPIISVWGMGGLGKTTIARKIYRHRDVQHCFQHFAWVCITQQAQIRCIMQDILMQLCPEKKEEIKNIEDRELVRQLYRVQTECKCLIVLDDIWYMHHWENLVHAFPIVEGGSKMMLTTRTKEVAEIGYPYELKCLNDEESWGLLKATISSRKYVKDLMIEKNIEAVGIEMVRKCGGLPLALHVLGGILKDKDSLREWKIVNKNIGSYLSTGKGNEEGSTGGAIAGVWSLSYNTLPYYLKPCFLCLGTFLEDEYIDAEELYLLWIAEGMVLSEHRRNGETLFNVAERYLIELGQRSMVQMQVNGFSTSCRLHDVMRDFCLKKGREEEFSEVIDLRGVEKPLLDSFSHANNDVYRLVVHININVEAPVNANAIVEDFKQLRCLVFRNTDGTWCSRKKIIWAEGLNVNYKTFKSLRVLKFEKYDFEGQDLPTGLEKLIHLRLLSFRGCNFDLSGLPSSIAEIPFLHTLDLRVSYLSKMPNGFLYALNVIEMPNVLGRMKRLRHLYLPTSAGIEVKEKVRLCGLSELERLEGFRSDRDEIADLYELPNLGVLDAAVTNNEGLCAIMNYMNMRGKNLQEISLTLSGVLSIESEQGSILLRSLLAFENLHHLCLRARISKFPRYEEQLLPGLVKLALQDTLIDEDPMESLEKLPQLRYLAFEIESYRGTHFICHELGFPQLRYLRLSRLFNLRSWRVEKGAMSNLSCLQISTCQMLEMIPEGLKDVASLKELTIFGMPRTFVDRIKVIDGREGKDFDKIKHIASITFQCC